MKLRVKFINDMVISFTMKRKGNIFAKEKIFLTYA